MWSELTPRKSHALPCTSLIVSFTLSSKSFQSACPWGKSLQHLLNRYFCMLSLSFSPRISLWCVVETNCLMCVQQSEQLLRIVTGKSANPPWTSSRTRAFRRPHVWKLSKLSKPNSTNCNLSTTGSHLPQNVYKHHNCVVTRLGVCQRSCRLISCVAMVVVATANMHVCLS